MNVLSGEYTKGLRVWLLNDVTWVLVGCFAILSVAYFYFWLKGGNGIWRWKYGDRPESMDLNTPLYGYIGLTNLVFAIWYSVLALNIELNGILRMAGRSATAVAIITLFIIVAIIRKPWGH